jgi:membrane protease subunit HflC
MKQRNLIIPGIVVFLVAGLVLWNSAFFVVNEWEQAIVIQLGKPVRTVTKPGLSLKLPIIQNVVQFDKRLLEYDAAPKELLTRDKQQLVVDNYSRWRIVDPLLYFQTLRNEAGAQSRLDDIIYSDLRENLGRHDMSKIISDREKIMTDIVESSRKKAISFGIEIIDVRIKRVDLPEKNEKNVFQRMRTERERLALKFRAEGDEESRKIRSEAERERKVLLAEATKTSSIIRGEGEAGAAKIFALAYNRDPDFYSFTRTLQAYETSLDEDTMFVLSPKSEFFRTLTSIGLSR